MPNKDTYFVMKDGVAIQPVIPQDGLELYYDVKGKKNTDNYKGTLLDMSGNGRHGTLSNFAYEGVSGFTGTTEGGLLLDDVDDKIVRPAISGIEYTSASRNLLNSLESEWESGTFSTLTANVVNVTRIRQINTYMVEPNVPHTISCATGYLVNVNVNGTGLNFAQSVSFTSTNGGGVRFVIKRTDDAPIAVSELMASKFQLEKGSVSTPYTPYIPLPIMTYQMNGNILSFEKDGTVKRTTKDANGNEVVVSRKGINLVRNGNFANEDVTGWNGVSSSIDGICRGKRPDANMRASLTQSLPAQFEKGRRIYIEATFSVNSSDATLLQFNIRGTTSNGTVLYKTINNPIKDNMYTISDVLTIIDDGNLGNSILYVESGYSTSTPNYGQAIDVYKVQAIDLTEAYGAGNEPTLAYIQSHPEEFAWTPNPNDLIETVEIKNNLVGDIENLQGNDFEQHEDGVITYTNEAEEGSVVRVDIDGISDQPLRFRTAEGQQVVVTEHDTTDTDAIKKIEFQGNSVQLTDKYREVSGTSVTIAPELHDKNVADKLVIGGNTTQYTESSNVVTDGLEMWLSGRNFSNSPATTTWKDLTGVNNGTASGFAYTSVSGSDGAGGIVFDGVDDGVIGLPSKTVYDYNSFTLEVKCIIDSTVGSSSVILGNRYSEGVTTSFFKLTPIMFEYYVNSVQHGISNTVNRNILVHLTIVKDKNTLKYFTNGELTSSKTLPVGLTMPPMPFGIGKDPFNTATPEPFKGKINFVRKYGRALTDAEVLQNYNAGLAIPVPNIAMPQEVKHVTSGSKIITHKKNFFDVSKITNLAWGLGDILLTSASYKSWYLPVNQGEVYSLSRSSTINNRFGIYFLATEPTANSPVFATPSYREDTGLKIENVQVPVGAKYIFVYLSNQSDTLPNIQLELGQNATTYEVFTQTETTIPVTLKSIG